MTALIVVAVDAERDAVLRSLPSGMADVVVAGVGPVAAAATTARTLAGRVEYSHVMSAGIAGAFSGRAEVGDVVVADAVVAADLGCRTDERFLTLEEMGVAQPGRIDTAGAEWAALLRAGGMPVVTGELLTLSCMTGTDAEAHQLAERFPDAVAEAMEGWGVAWAARDYGVPISEVRAISNVIGRRDRSSWDVDAAFDALSRAFAVLLAEPSP
jgi:futalosine hydrolase